MRFSRGLPRTFACAVVLSVAAAGHAAAHHDDGSSRLVRDNNTQDYDHNNLTAGGQLACDHGAAQLARSEISVKKGPNDIHCHDSYLHGEAAGTAECTKTVWWNGRCGHFRVWFNTAGDADTTPDTPLERNYWKALGCHEFGHTGGIGHVTGTTCMRFRLETHRYNIPSLNQDDLDHINAVL